MPDWLMFALYLTAGVIGVLAFDALRERREVKRCAKWLCPECGTPVGTQSEIRRWAMRIDPIPRGLGFRPTSGITVTCCSCCKDFQFTGRGRHYDEILEINKRDERT